MKFLFCKMLKLEQLVRSNEQGNTQKPLKPPFKAMTTKNNGNFLCLHYLKNN